MEPDEKIFFDTTESFTLSLPDVYKTKDFKIRYRKKSNKLKINYSQNLDSLSIQKLRILKFTLLAKNGYIFQDAYLRNYFCRQPWFQPIYWDAPFKLPIGKEDLALYNRIKIKEEEYLNNKGKDTVFRYNDLCNNSLFLRSDSATIKKLEQNGFIIHNTHHDNFWSLYELNRYEKVPSFITTDAFLHVVNLYYRFVMMSSEKESLIPTLDSLCYLIYSAATTDAKNSNDSTTIEQATFAQFYYGMACKLLNNKHTIVLANKYKNEADTLYTLAMEANSTEYSPIFDDKIPFNLFKPRGNYDSQEKMRRYFRAVSWLGVVPFKLKDDIQFKRILYLTSLLNSHKNISELYAAYTKTVAFLVGKADNPSLFDISTMKFTNRQELISHIKQSTNNKINEVGILADEDIEIFTIPKSYTPDAEAITKIVHLVEGSTRRAFPRGLDILAGNGIKKAEDILLNYYKENEKWPDYKSQLQRIKTIFTENEKKNANCYTYWLKMIATLFAHDKRYPFVMKKDEWNYKSLNAGLASYAQLKHNSVLYAEQPSGVEGAGDQAEYELPPPSIQVGYVEPNLAFWESTSAFINKLDEISSPSIRKKLGKLPPYLVSFSKKELAGQPLTTEEFEKINDIGVELETIENNLKSIDEDPIEETKSSGEDALDITNDNTLLTVADIYTINSSCLELGVGGVKDLYGIVPINGYNYLCRGGVFSYYEFPHDANNRLTDNEWQQMIEEKKLPKIQPWFQPFVLYAKISEETLYDNPKSFIKK